MPNTSNIFSDSPNHKIKQSETKQSNRMLYSLKTKLLISELMSYWLISSSSKMICSSWSSLCNHLSKKCWM